MHQIQIVKNKSHHKSFGVQNFQLHYKLEKSLKFNSFQL